MGNDFATPALYFFSTVAQTMGAILGIIITCVFVLIPLIKQYNNNPGSEVLTRLIKKDSEFIQSIILGFTSILTAVVGIFLLNIFGLSNNIAILLIIPFGLTCLITSIISCVNIWIFFRINSKYYNTLNSYIRKIIEIRYQDEVKIKTKDVIDYLEVSMFADIYSHTSNNNCAWLLHTFFDRLTPDLIVEVYSNILLDNRNIDNTISSRAIKLNYIKALRNFRNELSLFKKIKKYHGISYYMYNVFYTLYNNSEDDDYINNMLAYDFNIMNNNSIMNLIDEITTLKTYYFDPKIRFMIEDTVSYIYIINNHNGYDFQTLLDYYYQLSTRNIKKFSDAMITSVSYIMNSLHLILVKLISKICDDESSSIVNAEIIR